MVKKQKEEPRVFEQETVQVMQKVDLPRTGGFAGLNSGLIEDELSQNIETDNTIKSVSKELFNGGNIDVKTQLTHNEINDITKLRFLEKKFELQNIDILVDSMLRLRVSINRKSRSEFIQALQTENKTAEGSNWSKLFGSKDNNP